MLQFVVVPRYPGGETTKRTFVIVHCQFDLLQVVATLRAAGCFPRLLHGWQQQRNQNRDDCDDHEQFDQRKARSATIRHDASLP